MIFKFNGQNLKDYKCIKAMTFFIYLKDGGHSLVDEHISIQIWQILSHT